MYIYTHTYLLQQGLILKISRCKYSRGAIPANLPCGSTAFIIIRESCYLADFDKGNKNYCILAKRLISGLNSICTKVFAIMEMSTSLPKKKKRKQGRGKMFLNNIAITAQKKDFYRLALK